MGMCVSSNLLYQIQNMRGIVFLSVSFGKTSVVEDGFLSTQKEFLFPYQLKI